MTNDRQPLLGVSLVPTVNALVETVSLARIADETGLELLGLQDHPYNPAFVDTMTLAGAVLDRTRAIRVFPDVASLPLRPAAMLAKAAATLDLLSAGRFELGIGSGAVWPAITAYGGPALSAGEAVDALEEGVAVIRAIWSEQRGIRLAGEHHALRGAHGGPAPAHEIGLWIGSVSPRMLTLTGRLGDGWAAPIPSYMPFEDHPAAQDRIDAGAQAAGRAPSAIRRIAQLPGLITDARDDGPPRASEPIVGPVDRWIDSLIGLRERARYDDFVFWPVQSDEGQVRAFAEQVAPAVRQALTA
ncbi:MAG TPA: LLM class flavin-dependent oxidoreductase [Conexibacter sp.]|jgi:alkanesulfonate monooxygenase SsuD/methylene tetrahydromethanopterin reductase-like flavin-dependent oxidoreductase (luciferase family)